MSAIVIYKCDGPNCHREINLLIHANTWLKIGYNNLEIPIEYHFCGYICLIAFAQNQLVLLHTDP